MIAIALAHGLPYVAQSTAGYPQDITKKVKTALNTKGPSYIQILAPCIPGWKILANQAMLVGQLAVKTGLYPLLEYTNGKLSSKSKIPEKKVKVDEYLKLQGRFSHLFKNAKGKEGIKEIQSLADMNIKKYGL
jgi:pyruvate ferredoxin oxidoreductase beta subunit